MLRVGITGGIGAGKSVVCRVFKTLGIPVFDADETAKQLMESDPQLISNITRLFGSDMYSAGKLNREQLAAKVFNQPELLQQLNAIVHPVAISYGAKWMAAQSAPYVIKEAAIFFETGSNKDMDVMIGVFAPSDVRISRAMQRPGMTREKTEQRMSSQMDDAKKMNLCDYIITNDGNKAIIPQVMELHKILLERAAG